MPKDNNKLYSDINQIFYEVWDPIGVNHDAPQDEYSSYVLPIYKAVIRGDSKDKIAYMLDTYIQESMEMDSQLKHCQNVAELILNWSKWVLVSPPDAAVFTTKRVADKKAEVYRLIRDNEGDWQALDDMPWNKDEAAILALACLIQDHPALSEPAAQLDKESWGMQATRTLDGSWKISKYKNDEP